MIYIVSLIWDTGQLGVQMMVNIQCKSQYDDHRRRCPRNPVSPDHTPWLICTEQALGKIYGQTQWWPSTHVLWLLVARVLANRRRRLDVYFRTPYKLCRVAESEYTDE